MATVRVTTNQGIEDIAAEEVTRLLAASGLAVAGTVKAPSGLGGVVTVEVPALSGSDGSEAELCDEVWNALSGARSIYHVVVHTGEVQWSGGTVEELAGRIAELPFSRMAGARSFRASCSRLGEHPFQSPDVEVAVGTALQARYGTAVDLENYEVNVRVDIIGERCLCGYQLTGRKGLDRRHHWKYHPRVTLRTTVAYAMLNIAGYEADPGDLHDPFCGSGTILLEAAGLLAGGSAPVSAAAVSPEPAPNRPRISGSDWSLAAVDGCRSNLEAAGLAERVRVDQRDARDLAAGLDESSLDYIVTNPPFGIRLGHDADLGALYRRFLDEAAIVLRPGGVLALLVGKRRGRFNKVLQATPEFGLEHVRIIEIGGVYPGLFVLRRTGGELQ